MFKRLSSLLVIFCFFTVSYAQTYDGFHSSEPIETIKPGEDYLFSKKDISIKEDSDPLSVSKNCTLSTLYENESIDASWGSTFEIVKWSKDKFLKDEDHGHLEGYGSRGEIRKLNKLAKKINKMRRTLGQSSSQAGMHTFTLISPENVELELKCHSLYSINDLAQSISPFFNLKFLNN